MEKCRQTKSGNQKFITEEGINNGTDFPAKNARGGLLLYTISDILKSGQNLIDLALGAITMSIYTSHLYSRIAIRYQKYGKTRQTVVFFAGYAVQHIVEKTLDGNAGYTLTDISEVSPFIGRTANAVFRSHPYLQLGSVREMTDFCETINCDLPEWIAGRWEFLKLYTADNHVSSRLLNIMREVMHGK